jgi:hypothetical protein
MFDSWSRHCGFTPRRRIGVVGWPLRLFARRGIACVRFRVEAEASALATVGFRGSEPGRPMHATPCARVRQS